MITLNVFLKIDPKQKKAFQVFLDEMTEKSLEEAGNLYYNYFYNDDEFVIIEYWKDQDALDFHYDSDHLNNFLCRIDSFLIEPFSIQKYIPYTDH